MGPEVGELEAKLSEFTGAKHTITCSSGTDALTISLMALDVGPGDAVITTPFTFFATVESICHVGATPVFVDIAEGSYNIDADKIEATIEKIKAQGKLTPKAIIPVDIFGEPADYTTIKSIALKHGLKVIADAAQSFGSKSGDQRTGNVADVTVTSFYPTKPLSCYGDGGGVFTNCDDTAFELRSIRVHGQSDNKYISRRLGLTARMDTIQAAVILQKLPIFEKELARRNEVAAMYTKALKQAPFDQKVSAHNIGADRMSAWAHYTILVDDPEMVSQKLGELGVPTMRYYPVPMHLQTPLKHLGYEKGDFPVCENVSDRVISLPLHPYMTDEEVGYVLEQLAEVI
jgi:Predicted pyridoxal phosphate-dependent enzyme apparently involved in regulation of cell wall biogenesis